MRELAKDPDREVRQAAAQALGRLAQPEDLPLLRELAKDPDWVVRQAAAQVLGRLAQPEDLPLLRELAKDQESLIGETAMKVLMSFSREELEVFLNRHDEQLSADALTALDELLYTPEWLKPKDRKQEMEGG